jgi:hypothetical protein
MGEGQDERVNQGKRKKNKALSHQEKKIESEWEKGN